MSREAASRSPSDVVLVNFEGSPVRGFGALGWFCCLAASAVPGLRRTTAGVAAGAPGSDSLLGATLGAAQAAFVLEEGISIPGTWERTACRGTLSPGVPAVIRPTPKPAAVQLTAMIKSAPTTWRRARGRCGAGKQVRSVGFLFSGLLSCMLPAILPWSERLLDPLHNLIELASAIAWIDQSEAVNDAASAAEHDLLVEHPVIALA